MNWGDIGGGAMNGAMMGFGMGGPGGAVAGAFGGGLMGALNRGPMSASEMNVNPLDIKAEAKALMPTAGEQASQYSAFNQQLNGQVDTYKGQLIASGMNPNQAAQLADNRYMSSRNKYQANNQNAMANMERGLMSSMLPAKMQRDEDILNINLQNQFAPSMTQQMLPASMAMMGMSDNGSTLFTNLNKKLGWGG